MTDVEVAPATSAFASRSPERILVADFDRELAGYLAAHLRVNGFETLVTHDGGQARQLVASHKPDLAVVEADLPGLNGLELTRQLRSDPMTGALPIVILSGSRQPAQRTLSLSAGADDVVTKPFDVSEVVTRIRTTLRRNQEYREVSPLTGLPGNNRILREIAERVRVGGEYAVCVFDIDRFKSVNDVYGFERGDEFITLLANCLHRSAKEAGDPSIFLGHIGGDDFVLVCPPDQVRAITQRAVEEFEQAADQLYDPEDAARGYLEVVDRRGNVQRPNLVTISVGVALSTCRRFTDPREVIAVANEMKRVAKRQPGSFVAYDRRRSR